MPLEPTSIRKRAVIYCRVSTDKQEQDGESLDYQEAKCRQYAALHGIDVILVLKETKSGFIHYSMREKLTLARQMIRDGLADMIIVWDLRRFSRNFVHSAMIFEEVESVGAQIVSVSENIDNSLTGKLIRSILAWSAESEREKIVEYANRHWQTRLEQNLPVATGRAPYGWAWEDDKKTKYVIDKEKAALRVALFRMFIDEDMSLRSIAHKLTEDGIAPPANGRYAKGKPVWRASTVRKLLTDPENIGILRICKTTSVMTDKGTKTRKPNPNMKTIPGGIPAIVAVDVYELAQIKLKNNRSDKSHPHRNPEDFLLKGHIYCKTCQYRMHGRYVSRVMKTTKETHLYPFYCCINDGNKYVACPERPLIRSDRVDQLVWEECCRVFERLESIQATIEFNVERALQNILEDTQGKVLIEQLKEEIQFAKKECDKHPEGSYYYNLIAGDIRAKEAQLARYEEEYQSSINIVRLSSIYQQSTIGFLSFLTSMRGRYEEATFAEKRNALDILGVRVYVHSGRQVHKPVIETDQEWLTIKKAARLAGIPVRTLRINIERGKLATCIRTVPMTVIHRDELASYLENLPVRGGKRRTVNLDQYQEEWFTVNKLAKLRIISHGSMTTAIRRGKVKAQTRDISLPFIHRDELNRFLEESCPRSRSEMENIEPRVEVQYSPIFTGLQPSER
ncbi:recombinase family protein [Thermogemmatispora carboxidivorans]|uniref:recombinase family protein n=1 Tax=Thermogemmatispora carboxidivorans TaxID=1382306 RepID=UPI0009DCA99E|nr:recombinase family protein [Thermogemmatispora carboxidivorans]